jgi:hypothetical protein
VPRVLGLITELIILGVTEENFIAVKSRPFDISELDLFCIAGGGK